MGGGAKPLMERSQWEEGFKALTDGGQQETSASGKQATTEKQRQLHTDGEPEPLQPAGPGSRGGWRRALTQNMTLNPKIKYLMQQLTS